MRLRAREGAGLADDEFPCRGPGASARSEARWRGRGSRLGVPKLPAAPPCPPSCPRPDSRGGGGGDPAGSGCAAAGCLLRSVSAARAASPRSREGGWSRGLTSAEDTSRGPGGSGPGGCLGAPALESRPRCGVTAPGFGAAGGPRARGDLLQELGPRCSGGFVRNCVLAVD